MSLRILFVSPAWPRPERPADAVFVRAQAEALLALGARVGAVVPLPRPGAAPQRWLRRAFWRGLAAGVRPFDGGPVPVRFVPYARSGGSDEDVVPAMADAVAAAVAEDGPDAWDVVCAQWLWPGGAAALALRERFSLPMAAVARGGDVAADQWYGARATCRAWVPRVLAAAEAPLANCRHLRRRCDEILPGSRARMRVVYNGIDGDRFRPGEGREEMRRRLRLGGGDRLLLFCGDVSPVKGVAVLARAFARFRARRPEWSLLVVGPHADAATLRGLRRECGGGVRAPGPVPPGEIPRILAAADAYVQPSLSEGLANATLEAMAMALPVITSSVAGQPEAVDGRTTGWLVPPGDAGALEAALEAVAVDPAGAAARGVAARARARGRFSRAVHARRLLRILEGVARAGVRREGAP